MKESLTFRKANKEDAQTLFDWANDAEVRKNAFNQEPIVWENHLAWFNKKLSSEETEIYLLEKNKIPVGQIRVDLNEKGWWVIDYSIDSYHRGNGYGRIILEKLISVFHGNLLAEVKLENIASQRVFEKMSFQRENLESKIIYTLKNE